MAELTEEQFQEIIQTYFEVPGLPGMYILGCLARHVTLYSQQVRALNLVYALQITRRIRKGTTVAVIGAGAAGLTAAAALTQLGCNATLIESFESPMELQRNNRQRWIHPHLYDWPNLEYGGDQANIPILDWSAGYAYEVAKQIQDKWDAFNKIKRIDAIFSITELEIRINRSAKGKRYHLTWECDKGHKKWVDADHIIVAVGYGLEPESPHRHTSYWAEDDLDVGFRDRAPLRKWLIVGSGDSALTDLMRLCIRDFRHAKVPPIFETMEGMAALINDLREMHENTSLSNEELSDLFRSLDTSKWDKILLEMMRLHGQQIYLASKNPHIYGRGSSVLNRLIVSMLDKNGAFELIPAELTGGPIEKGNKLKVQLGDPPEVHEYDRVIVRKGIQSPPIAAFARSAKLPKDLNPSWDLALKKLSSAWDSLNIEQDMTRKRQWPLNHFEPRHTSEVNLAAVARVLAAEEKRFDSDAEKIGFRISTFVCDKVLREDGSSEVKYTIEGLSCFKGKISGIHFHFESPAGKVGVPLLEASAGRRGFTWIPDPEFSDGNLPTMDQIRAGVCRRSGTVNFRKPLHPAQPPLTFSLTVTTLNGDARSVWEFNQLHESEHRVHVDNKLLEGPMEYFARPVWCPIETLKLLLTLPRGLQTATPNAFSVSAASEIPTVEIIADSVVEMFPRTVSAWNSPGDLWSRDEKTVQQESFQLESPSAQTWELTIPRPRIGSCYSIDWKLAEKNADHEIILLEKEAEEFSKKLLKYRNVRCGQDSSGQSFSPEAVKRIRSLFRLLHNDFASHQGQLQSQKEDFEVAFMAYNRSERRLKFIDGTSPDRNREPRRELWEFWFPFGLGLAGACFKKANEALMYFRDRADKTKLGPEYYLDIDGTMKHGSMIAIPVNHPRWPYPEEPIEGYDQSKQLIGVIDISMERGCKWLENVEKSVDGVTKLRAICQRFSNDLCAVLNGLA